MRYDLIVNGEIIAKIATRIEVPRVFTIVVGDTNVLRVTWIKKAGLVGAVLVVPKSGNCDARNSARRALVALNKEHIETRRRYVIQPDARIALYGDIIADEFKRVVGKGRIRTQLSEGESRVEFNNTEVMYYYSKEGAKSPDAFESELFLTLYNMNKA